MSQKRIHPTIWGAFDKNGNYDYDRVPADYRTLVDIMGTVLVETNTGGYSGNSLYLLHRDGRFGLLIFGWGSCSHCDAIQSCDSREDVQELCDLLFSQIKWREMWESMRELIFADSLPLADTWRGEDYDASQSWWTGTHLYDYEVEQFQEAVRKWERKATCLSPLRVLTDRVRATKYKG